MSKGFYVLWENRNSTPLLRVAGELDIVNSPRLREVLLVALSAGASSVTFDLSRLEFMDSSGIAVLVVAYNETAARGGRVFLTGVSERIQRLLNLLQVQDQLSVLPANEPPAACVASIGQ